MKARMDSGRNLPKIPKSTFATGGQGGSIVDSSQFYLDTSESEVNCFQEMEDKSV